MEALLPSCMKRVCCCRSGLMDGFTGGGHWTGAHGAHCSWRLLLDVAGEKILSGLTVAVTLQALHSLWMCCTPSHAMGHE